MKKTEKIVYTITTTIQILLLIGAYMVNYFTNSRMGMARHVIHKNYILESTYEVTTIKYAIIAVFVVLAIGVLAIYIKKKLNTSKLITRMNITMVLSVIAFSGFITIYSSQEIRAFYYVSCILAVIILIQIIKTFISVLGYKNSK